MYGTDYDDLPTCAGVAIRMALGFMCIVLAMAVTVLVWLAANKELDNADRTYYDKEYKQMMYTEERV